ncbi:MAG: NfeD family protein, partial [Candidatus Limnocylindrales bacterium]
SVPRRLSSLVPRLPAVLLVIGICLAIAGGARAAEPRVVLLPTSGIVDQVMARYLHDRVADAAASGAAAAIIQLDTPGGDLEATRSIVGTLLEAPLPVIVWVSPSGAHAASAGTFITLAANLAYMAPGTNIGAASPIGANGEDIPGTLGVKVKNDAITLITSIAQARGRDIPAAVATVDTAAAYTAQEAIDKHLVDGLAADLPALLAALDGRTVTVGTTVVTLATAGAAIDERGMNPFDSFLHLLADPNIAFILFTVGFYGLLLELFHPNFVTGILGALSIILAFIGFGSLPLNVGGLLLLGLSGVLFMLELTVTSHGLLAVGGLVCFALGGSALYSGTGSPTEPVVSVAFPVIAAMVLTSGAFMSIVVATVVRQRRLAPSPSMVGPYMTSGVVGEIRRPTEPLGTVFAADEEWSARSGDGSVLARGTPVRVVRQEGLVVVVEPLPSGGPQV